MWPPAQSLPMPILHLTNLHVPCLHTPYACGEHCPCPCPPYQAMPSSPNTTMYLLILWKRSRMCMEARSVSPATQAAMERSSCLARLFTTSPSYWVCSIMHAQVCVWVWHSSYHSALIMQRIQSEAIFNKNCSTVGIMKKKKQTYIIYKCGNVIKLCSLLKLLIIFLCEDKSLLLHNQCGGGIILLGLLLVYFFVICLRLSGWADQPERYWSDPSLCSPPGAAQRQHAILQSGRV